MKQANLIRLFSGAHGTFGRLELEGRRWWCLERPPTGEHPCIPAGTYGLTLGTHHAGQPDAYPCYWLQDVPGRSAIEIHVANYAFQLEGCLAPGEQITHFLPQDVIGVSGSGDAFKEFMSVMQGQPGQLTITESF